MEKIAYLGETILRWRQGPSTFLAHPERGARLMNWNVTLPDGSVRDVIYWPELSGLEDFATVHGGNPILFPFCGRSFDRGDPFFWRDASGTRRPMPLHGIARQGRFEILRRDDRGFSALFRPGPEASQAYPFDYEFRVTYRFEPLRLFVEFDLQNLGSDPLPWAAGHHFYFTMPWREDLGRADYRLEIPRSRTYVHNVADGRLETAPAPEPGETLADPGPGRRIHTELGSSEVALVESPSGDRVVLRLGTDPARSRPGNAVVTWTRDERAPFFCVEPWMAPPNSPEHGHGLEFVPAGRTGSFVVEIALEQEEDVLASNGG